MFFLPLTQFDFFGSPGKELSQLWDASHMWSLREGPIIAISLVPDGIFSKKPVFFCAELCVSITLRSGGFRVTMGYCLPVGKDHAV